MNDLAFTTARSLRDRQRCSVHAIALLLHFHGLTDRQVSDEDVFAIVGKPRPTPRHIRIFFGGLR